MSELEQRAKESFRDSRKLKDVDPNQYQLENVEYRLQEIFTTEELDSMSDKEFARQVERVWPIAKYVDQE